jgi:hypothetical protein
MRTRPRSLEKTTGVRRVPTVMIEPHNDKVLKRRNRLPCGSLEWCYLSDWRADNERARFYGYGSKELPASMVIG